jgi:D-amino peptidase
MQKKTSIFISFDFEGISGVTSWREMKKDSPDLERIRMLATREVNAAIRGAKKGGKNTGIGEILVCDAHANGENLLIGELEKGVYLIKGTQRNYYMMEGINPQFDLAFFIGYHAMAGSEKGMMDHTYSSTSIYQVAVNGQPVGETEINAAIAGHHGVPLGLVSGDDTLIKEVRRFFSRPVETVITKYSLSRYAAKCRHPMDVQKELELMAKRAVRKARALKPFNFKAPLKCEIAVINSQIGDVIKKIPGLKRQSGRTFTCETKNILDFYQYLMLICDLAAYANASAL